MKEKNTIKNARFEQMYAKLLLSFSKLHKCDGLEQALTKNNYEFQILSFFFF